MEFKGITLSDQLIIEIATSNNQIQEQANFNLANSLLSNFCSVNALKGTSNKLIQAAKQAILSNPQSQIQQFADRLKFSDFIIAQISFNIEIMIITVGFQLADMIFICNYQLPQCQLKGQIVVQQIEQ